MTLTLEAEARRETAKVMLAGLFAAFIMNAWMVSLYFNKGWTWTQALPVRWGGIMLGYMNTFFHELGHTALMWFYGYIALPAFDFVHGGGMSYGFTGQLIVINLMVYAGLGYLFVLSRGYPGWQKIFVALALFHLATAYTDFHEIIYVFAGPLSCIALAGYMLYRAWLDVAPRGIGERFANAAFGFGFTMHALVEGWALGHDPDVRGAYLLQKGGHARGDFDRVAEMSGLSFNNVMWIYLICTFVALIVPVLIYMHACQQSEENAKAWRKV